VAAVSYAITMYSAGAVISVVTVTATIGFGLSVAGYCLKNPVLSVIGGIMTGFSGGFAMASAANWSTTAAAMNGIMGATASFLNSPLSPLDAQSRQIVGWAWTAYGLAISINTAYNKAQEAKTAQEAAQKAAEDVGKKPIWDDNRFIQLADSGQVASDAAQHAYIKGFCRLISGGEIAGVGKLDCKFWLDDIYSATRYVANYEGYFVGLTYSPTPAGVTLFDVMLQNFSTYQGLEAVNGWANITTAGGAFIGGGSYTNLILGNTMTAPGTAGGLQYGFDLSADWLGGYGRLITPIQRIPLLLQ